MDSTSFALWKRHPRSASAAEKSTFRMIKERIRMDPLMGEGVALSDSGSSGMVDADERKKYSPALDRTF